MTIRYTQQYALWFNVFDISVLFSEINFSVVTDMVVAQQIPVQYTAE